MKEDLSSDVGEVFVHSEKERREAKTCEERAKDDRCLNVSVFVDENHCPAR